ncbi:MAG: hypothetical protein ACUVTL_11065, partial [Thermoproteota archaeon]
MRWYPIDALDRPNSGVLCLPSVTVDSGSIIAICRGFALCGIANRNQRKGDDIFWNSEQISDALDPYV